MPRMRTPWHRAPTPRWKGGSCSPKLGLSPTRVSWYRSPFQAIRITPTVRRTASLLISLTGSLILPSATAARMPSMRIAQAPPPLWMVRSSIWSPPPTAGCTRSYRPNPPGLWRRGLHYGSETEPLSTGGGCYAPAQDRRRGDAHILGYYVSYVHTDRLVVWYIRNAIAQDRGAGNRKPEKPGCRSSEGDEVAPRLLLIIRLYYRAEPERIPQMSDLCELRRIRLMRS